MRLSELGWDRDWQSQMRGGGDDLAPARVVREDRLGGRVACEAGVLPAELAGEYRFRLREGGSGPVVGDWVLVHMEAGHARAIIRDRLERRTVLGRRSVDPSATAQILAANVDTVFIVCGLDGGRGFTIRGIERYLAAVRASGAEPVVVLNKTDLCETVTEHAREAEAVAPGIHVLCVSARTGEGLADLRAQFAEGRTAVFLGPSGVGKSALVNRLLGESVQAEGGLREKDGRGRHTTTARELFVLPGGGVVIDTPGLREFSPGGSPSACDDVFGDISELAASCRFRDCRHEAEPGCAVQEALGRGELDLRRFENYLQIRREMAYLERRQAERTRRIRRAGKPRLHGRRRGEDDLED